jgi:hypothetical protein
MAGSPEFAGGGGVPDVGWGGSGGAAGFDGASEDGGNVFPGDPLPPDSTHGNCEGIAQLSPEGWTPAPSASLDGTRAAMLGRWTGTATSHWVPHWGVEASFAEDGTYSGRSNDLGAPAFYWGTDDDTPLKRWWLDAWRPGTSVAAGGIDIIYSYGTPEQPSYQESGYQGSLDCVQVSADGQRLRFELWYDDTRGPVVYDLRRAGNLL